MANRHTIARLSMPLAAVTLGFSLTACNGMTGTTTKTVTESATSAKEKAETNASDAASENSDSGNSENSDSDKSDEATSESSNSSTEDSPTSSESPSDDSADSSSESSSEPSDSETSSSSDKTEISNSDFIEKARNNEVAACQISDLDYIRGGARYCTVDKSNVTAKYRGQALYVTYATRLKTDHKYSGRISLGGESRTTTFDNNLSTNAPGSLYIGISMRKSGTYKFEFLDNGKVVKTKSVEVSAD